MDIESASLSEPIFDPLFCTPQDVDGVELPAEMPAEDGALGPDK